MTSCGQPIARYCLDPGHLHPLQRVQASKIYPTNLLRGLEAEDLVALALLLQYHVGLGLVGALARRADLGHHLERAGCRAAHGLRLVPEAIAARLARQA